MPTRSATAAAIVLAAVGSAHADTNVTLNRGTGNAASPAITPDAFRVGEILNGWDTVGFVTNTTIAGSRVTFEVASTSYVGVPVNVSIALPRGTRVTGMTVTIGRETTRAELRGAAAVHSEYFEVVHQRRDPALLEHSMTTATSELLTFRVYPLTSRQHAMVTLELGSAEDVGVDDAESLYAANTAQLPAMVLGREVWVSRYNDKATIRRVVQLAMPRLRYCYQRELLHAPKLAGTAEMHFVIDRSGKTTDVSVDGTLPSDTVKQCIAADIGSWQFSPTDDATAVNYQLTFVASE